MSEYVFMHIKTLDIFIIDIDHLNMDLLISSSLHRQPKLIRDLTNLWNPDLAG